MKWIQRIIAALTLGFAGAISVPFLSIEVYRFLLNLGVESYQITIRLSNKFQTPSEFFAQQMVVFGAILGVASGYMFALQLERRWREVWTLSLICSGFALLFSYSLLIHPIFVLLNKKQANALALVFTSFLVPAAWSFILLLWGYKVYGAQKLSVKQWDKSAIIKNTILILVLIIIQAVVDE